MKIKLPTPKQIWTALSNPLVRIIVGIAFMCFGLLDGEMRGCAYSLDYYSCQSFIGKGFDILFMVILASFFIELSISAIESIKTPRKHI